MEQPYAIDGIYYELSDETHNKNKRSNNLDYKNSQKNKYNKEINFKKYFNLGKRLDQNYPEINSEINNFTKKQKLV